MPPRARMLWLEWGAVTLIAIAARWLYPNPWVQSDEYFHLLGARSLLSDGTLAITPGAIPYERAWLYTYAVAGAYALLGDTIASGRMVSLLCGVGLVVAVFGFLRRHADAAAAWAGALLLCFALPTLQLSHTARFYMPHVFFVWLMAWAGYELVRATDRRAVVGWALALVAATAAAAHMQLLTLLPATVLGGWMAAMLAVRCRSAGWKPPRWVVPAAVLGLAAVAAVLWLGGAVDYLVGRYNAPRVWAEESRGDYLYYHRQMMEWRGTLYALSPLAILIALRDRPRLAAWATILWLVPYVSQAFLHPKADRYVMYTLPFFFVLWGLALSWGGRMLVSRAERVLPGGTATPWLARAAVVAGLAAAVFYFSPEYRRVTRMIALQDPYVSPYRKPTFTPAAPRLQRYLAEADVVISSGGLRALYELGRLDYLLSLTALEGRPDGTVDRKINRVMIAQPESVLRIMDEHPRGLLVAERWNWRNPANVPAETVAAVVARARPVELDPTWFMVAFVWGDWDDPPSASVDGAGRPLVQPTGSSR